MQFFTRILSLAAAAAPFIASAAPLASRATNELIPGKYIIQLKPETDIASIAAHHNKVRSIHARNLGRHSDDDASTGMEREFQIGDFKAYSGSFDDVTVEELKAMPEVSRAERERERLNSHCLQVLVVEQDYMMSISGLVTRKLLEC
jgi:oryzin